MNREANLAKALIKAVMNARQEGSEYRKAIAVYSELVDSYHERQMKMRKRIVDAEIIAYKALAKLRSLVHDKVEVAFMDQLEVELRKLRETRV